MAGKSAGRARASQEATRSARPPPIAARTARLGDRLAEEAAPPGAERHPHGEVATARRGAGEGEAGEVGGGAEQHEGDGAGEGEERRLGVAAHVLVERPRDEAAAAQRVGPGRVELLWTSATARRASSRVRPSRSRATTRTKRARGLSRLPSGSSNGVHSSTPVGCTKPGGITPITV